MKKLSLALALTLVSSACSAQDTQDAQEAATGIDENAIFTAAGFTKQPDGSWRKCDDPGTASYSPGAISETGDFNGDGRPEAVVNEGGTYCYGFSGNGYTLVSQMADGKWTIRSEGIGLANMLETKGSDGWPDLEVGGPGFCFPVLRWNGAEYALNRHEYDGQACRP